MAPKGSALNNPFRMLPRGVMAIIKPMTKSWSPTPSARAIKQADVWTDYHGLGDHLEVYTRHTGVHRSYYLLPHRVDERVVQHYPLGTVFSKWDLKDLKRMGVEWQATWIRLRKRHSFFDTRVLMGMFADDPGFMARFLKRESVLNNPFRMLPPEVMANIKAMNSDRHPPTQTACLIKALNFDEDDFGLIVSTNPRHGINFRERVHYQTMGWRQYVEGVISETNMLTFYMDSEGYKRLEDGPEREPPLGRVLSDNDVALRRMQDERVGRRDEIHRLWLAVQREQAEASGMY